MEKLKNEYIRSAAHIRCLEIVSKGILRWFGHVQKHDGEYIGIRILILELQVGGQEEDEGGGLWM